MSHHGHEGSLDSDEHWNNYVRESCKMLAKAIEPKPAAKPARYAYRTDKRSLLEIALDIHTTNTGAYERTDAENQADKEKLAKRLEEWHPQWTLGKGSDRETTWLRFDEAVRHLLLTVLEEKSWRE